MTEGITAAEYRTWSQILELLAQMREAEDGSQERTDELAAKVHGLLHGGTITGVCYSTLRTTHYMPHEVIEGGTVFLLSARWLSAGQLSLLDSETSATAKIVRLMTMPDLVPVLFSNKKQP